MADKAIQTSSGITGQDIFDVIFAKPKARIASARKARTEATEAIREDESRIKRENLKTQITQLIGSKAPRAEITSKRRAFAKEVGGATFLGATGEAPEERRAAELIQFEKKKKISEKFLKTAQTKTKENSVLKSIQTRFSLKIPGTSIVFPDEKKSAEAWKAFRKQEKRLTTGKFDTSYMDLIMRTTYGPPPDEKKEEPTTLTTSDGRTVTQADIEFTAKQNKVTVEEVKKRLGIK